MFIQASFAISPALNPVPFTGAPALATSPLLLMMISKVDAGKLPVATVRLIPEAIRLQTALSRNALKIGSGLTVRVTISAGNPWQPSILTGTTV